MESKSKPNFRIVEVDYEPLFPSFKRDFDDGVSKKDLMEKYDISNGVWLDWKERILKDNPLHPRRFRRGRVKKPKVRSRKVYPDAFVKGTSDMTYTVFRKIDGTRRSYGTYPSKTVAEDVLNELVEHNWNKYVAHDLLEEFAVPVSKKVLLSKIIERES